MDIAAHYRQRFASLESERFRSSRASSWLGGKRRDALERFAEKGFPTTSREAWKFTNVAPIARVPWEAALPVVLPSPALLSPLRVTGAIELVFINGHFATALSALPPVPEGVRVLSLAAALEDDSGFVKSDWIEPHLASLAAPADNPFVALNTAFFADGAFVYLPRGTVLAAPIHLLFVAAGDQAAAIAHPRNLLVAGSGAQATVIETYASLGAGVATFCNAVSEVVAGDGAVLDHIKLGLESASAFHVATLQVRQERASSFRSTSVALGGSLVRNDINVVQAGEGIDCELDGLFVADGQQHIDHHTAIDHAAPHGTSRELYKGILDGQSHGVFDGKVIVRPGAQKTDSRQTNKNLLLSRDALIDTKPQLEIYADDVKCSHGATIGQLEADAVFYLRSRGLGEVESRSILTYAFASDVINQIRVEPVRDRLHERLIARLPGGEGIKEIV